MSDNYDKIKPYETSIYFFVLSNLNMLVITNPQIDVHRCILLQGQ